MIHEAWFTFNGIDSRYMGVIVTAMPETVRPDRRITSVKIPGRSGLLHLDEAVYESYIRTMECAIKNRENIDEIAAWLTGSGKMIFSTEPDKVYDVTISNKISIVGMMRTFQKFMVTMDTQPFKYREMARRDTLILTEGTFFRNKGNVYANPLITVYGTGDISLFINDEEFLLRDVEESITIDSEIMEVFRENRNQNHKYRNTKFPRLETGINSIDWTGEVTKVEVVPRWRYI